MPVRGPGIDHYPCPQPCLTAHLKRFMLYAGPGLLVAVGYMDPGNWATDIGAGSAFGYDL